MNKDNRIIELTRNMPQAFRVYDPHGIAITLSGGGGGIGGKTGLYMVKVKNGTKQGNINCRVGG